MKNAIVIFAFTFLTGCQGQTTIEPSEPSEAELHRVNYTSNFDQSERDFYVYLPKGYYTDSLKNWPIIMHLHGNGARGNGKDDLIWVTKHGPLMEAWVQKRDLPFIIIVPQLQMMGMDTLKNYIAIRDTNSIPRRLLKGVPDRIKMYKTPSTDTNSSIVGCAPTKNNVHPRKLPYPTTGNIRGWNLVENDLTWMVKNVQDNYRANPKKTYLTGISYGAFGTWYLSSTHPGVFAAIAPISGWGHPDLMPSLAQQEMPIWCFSGCQDKIIKTEDFYPGLQKLEELGFYNFQFTVEPNAGHDVWKKVFAGTELYSWLLECSL